ncbi:intersectin-2 [Hyalella azteca]|uniref:Intersectin-2 n=1 Tax=Hyalella azteca TaxID=294128 RepID=A0A8B7P2T8_HYAAZ|nr:intersectin-2 [Hyalella azteca]
MQFYIKSLSDDRLCITLMLKGYFRPNDFVGRAELLVQRLWQEQKAKQQQHPVPQVIKVALQETTAKDAYVVVKYSVILFDKHNS